MIRDIILATISTTRIIKISVKVLIQFRRGLKEISLKIRIKNQRVKINKILITHSRILEFIRVNHVECSFSFFLSFFSNMVRHSRLRKSDRGVGLIYELH